MKQSKRIVAGILAGVMALSTAFSPLSARAQISYDPQVAPNHGIYIDTVAVPNDGKNISISEDGKTITANKNVTFQLYSSVDVSWTIKAADDSNTAVTDGTVSINKYSGVVGISETAISGNYTITATAENVVNVDTATIKLVVGTESAEATSVKYDADAMGCNVAGSQFSVSDDGLTLTVDGKVANRNLAVKYEPEYLYNKKVSFTSAYATDSPYTVSGTKFTSAKKTEKAKIKCTVGNKVFADTLSVIINDKGIDVPVECTELVGSSNTYSLMKDQIVHFSLNSNEVKTLPNIGLTSVVWSLKQNDTALTKGANTETIDGITYNIFPIKDTTGKYTIGEILVDNKAVSKNIIVRTLKETEAKEVTAVKIQGTVTPNADNAGNAFKTKEITLNFNMDQTASLGADGAILDFAYSNELVKNQNYSVKKNEITVDGAKQDVYYFESDGAVLNIAKAIRADVLGVRSFEESRITAFGDGSTYKVTCELKDIEIFGSKDVNAKYNNNNLDLTEIDEDHCLKNNAKLTKKGVGYKALDILCMKGNTKISQKTYYVRFVSPCDDLYTNLKISKNKTYWYNLSNSETVHVRRGEAVIPGFYVSDGNGGFTARDAVSQTNPYIEYSVSNKDIAATDLNSEGTYRVGGLDSGIVTVMAKGAVDKTNYSVFTLYVNKDIYEGRFEITFDDAIELKYMDSSNVIDGKQDSVPVNLSALDANMAFPIVTWSLEWEEKDETANLSEVATINAKTGVITTYKSSEGKKIVVKAANSTMSDSKTFTVKKVLATGIKVLAEKVPANGKPVVTSTTAGSGSCRVGDTFTLYAADYTPSNATGLAGEITWKSSDTSKATVDKNGRVTALAQTTSPVVITASYTADGKSAATEYKLTISGYANQVTGIQAKDIILRGKGNSQAINAVVLPFNASNKKLTYVSSNTKVAKVNASGLVTAVGAGSCTITITSQANKSVRKVIRVTVIMPNGLKIKAPAKVKISVKNIKKKKVKVTLKKVSGATGYQIFYSTKKNMKGAKSVKTKKLSYTIKKLKKKKTYYIRARAYKKAGSVIKYGKYSAKKKIKIKK